MQKYINLLDSCPNENDVIRNLQKIGKTIISEYIIRVNDDSYIIPLWIEAYCFMPETFEDDACDNKRDQYYGPLYFNRIGTRYRKRVDIVPPHNPKFAFSCLLKLGVLVEKRKQNEILIQSEIADHLYKAKNTVKLEIRKSKTSFCSFQDIVITKRVNISERKAFWDKELGFYLKTINPNSKTYDEIRNFRNTKKFKNIIQEMK